MARGGKADLALLRTAVGRYGRDPAGFVRDQLGVEPDPWQADILNRVAEGLATPNEAVRIAVASGHGIGKSALVAWLLLWAMATAEDTRGVVTANTETQLRTKTWAELAKWFRKSRLGEWFDLTSTALASRVAERGQSWRIDLVPWSANNAEAFAGLHNQGRRAIVVFDEASVIPDLIWDTAEGALTDKDTELLWLVFGNPTRNSGRFRECFGRFGHRWLTRQIDSRTVGLTNKEQLARWVEDFGEDSDFVRVRVRGVFPRAGSTQFIPGDLAEAAARRELEPHELQPDSREAVVLGVDVARFGDDRSVICWRRGRDARSRPPVVLRGVDLMTLAGHVCRIAVECGASSIFVDEGGVGGGVVDRLHQLNAPNVVGVNFGGSPDYTFRSGLGVLYANKRAEMWGNLKEWLKTGAIRDEAALLQDLTGVEYGFNARNAIQLESKDDMKKRGLASPDMGDALALTFAYPAHPPADPRLPREPKFIGDPADYDPYHDA